MAQQRASQHNGRPMSASGPTAVHRGPHQLSPTRYRMLVETMRPKQWSKNAFVLAGIVFSGRALELDAQIAAWTTLVAFCAISSATYLVNDLRDWETDRLNPRTAGRPIARGDIGPRTAVIATVGCVVVAFGLAAAVNLATVGVVAGFAALQFAYSFGLKHVLFIDVMTIAAGFLARTLAGVVAIDAEMSPWLLLGAGLLALFLGLTKRRAEVVALGQKPATQRPVLALYSPALLDELIAVVTPSLVMVYALYGVLGAASDAMLATLPFVLYGVFRVLFLIHHGDRSTEDPSVFAIRDRPLLACIVLWGLSAGVITAVTL